MWVDRKWMQRVRLCSCLLMETVVWWCRTDEDFPISNTVEGILHLFSPRVYPLTIPESNLRSFLATVAESADHEYALAWPSRDQRSCRPLTDAIANILGDAEQDWTNGSMLDQAIESVHQSVVDVIVAHKYVVFHHTQTVRRDGGGFHSQG